MKKLLRLIILCCWWSTSAFAQAPALAWGPAVEQEPRALQNMHVIGAYNGGFFAMYQQQGQATLERYDSTSQRLWATALLPRTPEGSAAQLQDVLLLRDRLYLISLAQANGVTAAYAQELKPTGNYTPTIQMLASSQADSRLHLHQSQNAGALFLALTDERKKEATVVLLGPDLQPRWVRTMPLEGATRQVHVLNDGTAFILTQNTEDNTSGAEFLLYRLSSGQGTEAVTTLGTEAHELLQAQLASTPEQDLVVGGYYTSHNTANSQPEPTGTFYHRFGKGNLSKNKEAHYTPFDAALTSNSQRTRPIEEQSTRLRNLQLRQVLPDVSGGIFILGEVAYSELISGDRTFYNNNIVAVRLLENGASAYTTNISKQQQSQHSNEALHSFYATAQGDTLQLLYLDKAANYPSKNRASRPDKTAAIRIPVLVSILPDGQQQAKPLPNNQPGQEPGFYLRPTASFPVSPSDYIVQGFGTGYYKYGRLKL